MIAALLLRLARWPLSGWLAGFAFQWFGRLLPVNRVLCTRRIIVFRHPRPVYEDHLLIVPRRRVESLLELAASKQPLLFAELLMAARVAVERCGLPVDGYTLVVNGGPRQDVGQLHLHMFSGPPVARPYDGEGWWAIMALPDGGEVVAHPSGDWPIHLLLLPGARVPPLSNMTPADAMAAASALGVLPDLDGRYDLQRQGYSLIIQQRGVVEREQFVAHLVSRRGEW